ncbi:hypothetical protein TAMA11512_23650 [Selenomonas sp. TAMA-11512]|nr:hypothetical protein TAMA11512_23650 [Selenomonas sp. TAMA-11512]
MSAENKEPVRLRKSDLIKHWLGGYSQETCYNYERLQALGSTQAIIPVIKRLYKSKEERAAALKKYMIFFNTEPSYIGTVIPGICASMEEQAANGEEVTEEDINSLRTGLMGPMAGIGDTVSQGIVYPILAGIACSMALAGNIFGPILFEVCYKAIMLTCGYSCYMLGYTKGKTAVLSLLRSGELNRVTEIFSIIGLMVIGSMAATRVSIMTPIAFTIGEVSVTLQNVLDSLLPAMLPLAAVLAVWKLLERGKSPTYIIAVLFIVGILCSLAGLLAVPAAG